MPVKRWSTGMKVRWRRAHTITAHPTPMPVASHEAKSLLLWDWSYLNTQGFANFLQIVTLVLAAVSFKLYFIPEQTLKRLEERKTELEVSVSKLEGTVKAKDAEIAEKASLAEEATRNLAKVREEKAKAESDRDLAVAQASAARDRTNAAQKELLDLQRRLSSTEENLRSTQSDVVAIRQQARRRVAGTVAAYVAHRCAFQTMERFTECAVSSLSTGEFASVFAKREMQTAISQLRTYGAAIEEEWRVRSEKARKEHAQVLAVCESLSQPAERSRCEGEMTPRAMSKMQVLDPFITVQWLPERLKGWTSDLNKNLGCPYFGKGAPLPNDWPADCL